MDNNFSQIIAESLKQGKSKEAIYQELLAKGLAVQDIENYFIQATAEDENKEETQKQTIRVVAIIGALLIGLGVFSFIASNWDKISKLGRMSIVLSAMLLAYLIGWFLYEKFKLLKSGEAMIFLGSLLYGGAVFLAAQMYNTRVYWPDGFLWWALGTIAVAYITNLYSNYWLAVIAAFIGLIWYPFGFLGGSLFHRLFLTPWLLLFITAAAFYSVGFKLRREFLKESPDMY